MGGERRMEKKHKIKTLDTKRCEDIDNNNNNNNNNNNKITYCYFYYYYWS